MAGGKETDPQLRAKLDELHTLKRLNTSRMGSLVERLSAVDVGHNEQLAELFADTISIFTASVTNIVNDRWVGALMRCGLSEEEILRIWQTKEDVTHDINQVARHVIDNAFGNQES